MPSKAKYPFYDSKDPHLFHYATVSGKLVQTLFYVWLENTWAYDMNEAKIVRNKDSELVRLEIIDGPGVATGPRGQSTCERYADGWLIRFPGKLLELQNRDAMYALLADHSSIWMFMCMHAAVQTMFERLVNDVNEDIRELVHYPGDDIRRIVSYRSQSGHDSRRDDRLYPEIDPKGHIKGVYDITLKDGTRIILDPASAQWKSQDSQMPNEPVMRWQEYWHRWGGLLKYRIPFRAHHVMNTEKMNSYRVITHHTINVEQNFYFNMLMVRFRGEYSTRLSLAFNMNDDELVDYRILVFREAAAEIQKTTDKVDGTGSFKKKEPPHEEGSQSNPGNTSEVLEYSQSLPFDISVLGRPFDWGLLRLIITMPSKDIAYKEKKRAKFLLAHRCMYQMPGDWKMVFLEHTLPDLRVPKECVSENPYWKSVRESSGSI